ncbi:hypothetical protein [Streptomyces sp. NPDC058157]|uniref:hypothetical protein n=1 Tax=Streptomyces sp. NPDC058157 TaxID=3346360 RepID=UPI0036E29E96
MEARDCCAICASAAESGAPTTELRLLQYREDDRQGVGKRNRIVLVTEYVERHTREILDRFDLGALVAEHPSSSVTALFCVERDPQACHRSPVAERPRTERTAAPARP